MLDEMGCSEYMDWVEFYSTEPFPEERADFRNAMLMNLLARVNGSKVSIKDFIPDYWGSNDPQESIKSLKEKVIFMNAIYGGVDLRKKNA